MEGIYILAENIIKKEEVIEEPLDDIEEFTLNSVDGGVPWPVKREEEEAAMDDEEELEPPISVFLEPEGPNKVVEEEQKDPLAPCSESASVASVKEEVTLCSPGGEIESEPFSESKPRLERTFKTKDSNQENCLHLKKEEDPIGRAECIKHLESVSHFRKPYTSRHGDESSICFESVTENEDAVKRIQKSEGDYECSLCQKSFKNRSLLARHMLVHSGNWQYACAICKKPFKFNAHLTVHMRVHNQERPYKCSHCGRGFTQKGNFVRHMRTHSGERPHECSVCQKSFPQRSHLVTHMRIHTGERPHECSVCQKSFSYKHSLVDHMRIHSGERPHECSVCQKRFSKSSNLVTHMRTHTGERPYE